MSQATPSAVREYLLSLQKKMIQDFNHEDPEGYFFEDSWERPEGGGGISAILKNGKVFESLGVNFSHVYGDSLPASASALRPQLKGLKFEAMGISTVSHPFNPYVPTAHANVRFFIATQEGKEPIWWFGGGFDLTPYYGFKEDASHFHKMAREACKDIGDDKFQEFKQAADEYFFLKHRQEPRGIGGIFFDDYHTGDFDKDFAFMRSVGDHYIKAYLPIVNRRKAVPYSSRERDFQLYRRGRYVEFNLVYDRGTLFGLQSNGRTESILMSLPKEARWEYNWTPAPGSPEEELYEVFLRPTNWADV